MIIKEDRTGRAERAPRPKFDRFTFTVFFGGDIEQQYAMGKLAEYNDKNAFQYIVVGIELSPNTNRLHLQGYLELTTAVRPRALMRQLQGFHVEPAKENREANYRYCTKGKIYFISEAPISSLEMGVWGSATPPHASLMQLDDMSDDLDYYEDKEDYEYTMELKRFQAWNDWMKKHPHHGVSYIPDGLYPEDVNWADMDEETDDTPWEDSPDNPDNYSDDDDNTLQ